MANYINIESMKLEVMELLKDTIANLNFEHEEFVEDELNDEWLEDYASSLVASINNNMKTYLHLADQGIVGNFNRIDVDYCKHITGISGRNDELIKNLVSRLDSEDQSEQTKSDLDYMNDWFFDTFGTHGITYNFTNDCCEMLSVWEQEGKLEIA